MKNFTISLVFIFFIISCSTSNQVKNETQEPLVQQVNEKIQAKDFKIEVNYANPMGGKSIYLSYGYDLVLRNDSAIAYLPYFGRAYTAPYGGGEGGIKFRELMKDYSATPKKQDGEWTIKFKIDTPEYNYEISIDVFSNGKSGIYVNSNQRQPINFNGEMVFGKK